MSNKAAYRLELCLGGSPLHRKFEDPQCVAACFQELSTALHSLLYREGTLVLRIRDREGRVIVQTKPACSIGLVEIRKKDPAIAEALDKIWGSPFPD